jgi:peptidoglycan/xylan/chitin deacetylase (PgdA/CDA1 family)
MFFKEFPIKRLSILFSLFFPLFLFSSWNIIETEIREMEIIEPAKCPQPRQTYKYQDDKVMYLTFDDGPLSGSNNIISVLQEENVQATMFMIGKHVTKSKYRKKTFKRAIDEPLIQVANHTYSHADGRYRHFYSNKERLVKDIQKMDRLLVKSDESYLYPCCRLAGRNVWRVANLNKNDPCIPKKLHEGEKYDALSEVGFQIYGWDYQWSYNPKTGQTYLLPQSVVKNIEKIYRKKRTKTKGKFVLLMHDFSFRDKFDGSENLRTLIQLLKQKGWRFETLATYL